MTKLDDYLKSEEAKSFFERLAIYGIGFLTNLDNKHKNNNGKVYCVMNGEEVVIIAEFIPDNEKDNMSLKVYNNILKMSNKELRDEIIDLLLDLVRYYEKFRELSTEVNKTE